MGSEQEPFSPLRAKVNLYVADASIFETIPRANTHLATLALAERTAASI